MCHICKRQVCKCDSEWPSLGAVPVKEKKQNNCKKQQSEQEEGLIQKIFRHKRMGLEMNLDSYSKDDQYFIEYWYLRSSSDLIHLSKLKSVPEYAKQFEDLKRKYGR